MVELFRAYGNKEEWMIPDLKPLSRAPIVNIARSDRGITITWADGESTAVDAMWLRDNCPCPECRHPESGQRLLDTASVPDDTAVASASVSDATALTVTWQPNGHESSFTVAWLHAQLFPSPMSVGTAWDAKMMAEIPHAEYIDVQSEDRHLRTWLAVTERYGFALLHGVPTESATILSVVELFGYVRETNYGRVFDVRSSVSPTNLAYTGLPLGPHTDNPYRDPTPTLQLLHCLSSSAVGGDTTLVDGFRVAEDLRRSDPRLFELLTRCPVRYRYRDHVTDLTAEFPVISCGPNGDVCGIHFNNRSKEPFALPGHLVEAYYKAYRSFSRMLVSPFYQISLRLEPSDLVIMNNLRVLHGRTGFSAAGERHLQGCYADRDGLLSRLAVLSRTLHATPDGGSSQ